MSGITLVALPYVSKHGVSGEHFQSVVLGIIGGGFKRSRIAFFRDHTQVGARNAACRAALETGAEWLLFIDTDMDFPVDLLARLKACDADIACTDMWSRSWPSFRTVMRFDGVTKDGLKRAVPVPGKPSGVESIDVCGMACTLIRASLLEKMSKPWFVSGEHGEDASFCFKAHELGATMKCDFGIVAGHWGVARMAGQDFTRDARNNPFELDNPEMMERMGVLNLRA